MFLNYKKLNSRAILNFFCLSASFFLISIFSGALSVEAACITATECPEGSFQALPGSCTAPQIDCIPRAGGATGGETTSSDKYGLEEAGAGLSNTPISVRVSTMIGAIVGFVGVIFLVLMIYGGLTWMTAGGNEEKIGKAKKIIVNSTIGIVIVMLSYAITYYIIQTVSG